MFSASDDAVTNILQVSAEVQMRDSGIGVGQAAPAIVAMVKNIKPIGNRSVLQFPRDTVCADASGANADSPIPTTQAAGPFEAFSSLNKSFIEPLSNITAFSAFPPATPRAEPALSDCETGLMNQEGLPASLALNLDGGFLGRSVAGPATKLALAHFDPGRFLSEAHAASFASSFDTRMSCHDGNYN